MYISKFIYLFPRVSAALVMAWSAKEPEAEEEPERRVVRVEGQVGRDIVELEERVVEGRVTDETEGREEKETEEVQMATENSES